jgi:beta-galactosidase
MRNNNRNPVTQPTGKAKQPLSRNGLAMVLLCLTVQFNVEWALYAAQKAGDLPREKISLDNDWRFHLGDAPDAGTNLDYPEVKDLAKTRLDEIGWGGEIATHLPDPANSNLGGDLSFVRPGFDDRGWRQLNLPHDWAVELDFDSKADVGHGFKPVGKGYAENNIGWYRREFELSASDLGKTLWLEFDGVFRNSLVWLNGHCLGRHLDGYSTFYYDISRFARCGGTNVLVVRVDATRFQGWFYEGAGIYRHVWLVKTAPLHIAPDGVFVWSTFSNNVPVGPARVRLKTMVVNAGQNPVLAKVEWNLLSLDGKSPVKADASNSGNLQPQASLDFSGEIAVPAPSLWSPESPRLYRLVTTIVSEGKAMDRLETEFGIRTVAFDATNGFLLNGQRYQIKGTCNHQDHAGVGTAMPDALQYFRVKKLKEMGCNAIRTSHNPPTPELLEACDRLGMLVMGENRRMDNSAWSLAELRSLILRDRNHPSVFIWSLGNEENDLQGSRRNLGTNAVFAAHEAGIRVITPMQNLAHELDPSRLCTVAMNGGWGKGMSTVVDVQGFNYYTKGISAFRTAFPAKPTIGAETASTRFTRGIYFDAPTNGYVAAYGSNGIERAWQWWSYYATNLFTSGGFVWTGFDYRGEPSPYKWPCISSQFGLMDVCGLPKDVYFYYQSWWTDRPVLHIAPHWNWPDKVGQKMLVRVFSNCRQVGLSLNGKSFGSQTMQTNWFLDWDVPYAPGTLEAKGYNAAGKCIMATKVETTGVPAAIQLAPDRATIEADGQDVSVFTVSVVDTQGRVVPTAGNKINFELTGAGKIIGVGNGDPSCHEPDKFIGQFAIETWSRSVFNGLAQVIIQSTKVAGEIKLTARADGLKPATISVQSQSSLRRTSLP